MPLLIASIIIQVAFIIHIVKTGRNTTWIWIVLMLPMAGAIAYFILEVLPDLSQSKAGKSASKKVQSVVNPNRDINEAAKQFSISDTVENSMRLAEECYNKGLYADAKELYKKCLTGLHADNPDLIYSLAKVDFALGNHQDVKSNLDQLIELNPDYKNPEAHLLYARTLEGLNEISAALHEYETLHSYFTGPEASFFFAKFLQSQNQLDKADGIFRQILNKAENSGKHYKSLHKEILKQVKTEVSK